MNLLHILSIYAASAGVFLALDSVWLGKVAPTLYRRYIGHLLADKPNLSAAGLFYAIYLVGLSAFVLLPALDRASLGYAAGMAALYGLVTYATFDLTAQAVFKRWPSAITLIDLAWGMAVTTATSAVVFLLFN